MGRNVTTGINKGGYFFEFFSIVHQPHGGIVFFFLRGSFEILQHCLSGDLPTKSLAWDECFVSSCLAWRWFGTHFSIFIATGGYAQAI
jgi:hypothetical protein